MAFATSASRTCLGDVAVSLPCRYSAAAPATCGDAIEVPPIVTKLVVLVIHAEVIADPGANRSRQLPTAHRGER